MRIPGTPSAPILAAFLFVLAAPPLPGEAAEVRRITPRAAVARLEPAEEYVNPSALLFDRAPRRRAEVQEEGPPPEAADTPPPPGPVAPRMRVARTAHWNSEAARRGHDELFSPGTPQATLLSLGLAAPDAVMTRSAQFDGGVVCVEPDIVKTGSNCCSYGILDQVSNKKTYYRQPAWAFASGGTAASEQTCRDFAETVTASMPLYLPYRNGHVRASHGWFYNSGSFHGAVDYSKDEYPEGADPSFRIYAIGPGMVRSVVWDDWSGNIVVIEHAAPNGKKYRSAYKHMRNGFNHDLAKAKAIPLAADKQFDADGNPTQTLKYKRYANLPNPSQLQWGTDRQKIAVKPGDKVHAGQFLGWSGNTGPGGAGKGLNDDGTPKNTVTANNHLHFMTCVPHPTGGETEWVQVDPYGVYGQVDSDCYDMLDDTPYARLFAPYYPAFHNVPVSVLAKRFGYFPSMGYGLQTLSLHRKGDKVLASGAFQHGLPSQWKCRFYMTAADYQHWFDEYGKTGLRPRELSVTNDAAGNARFTAIWKKGGSESFVAAHNMTDADWKKKWDELVVKGKMRVEECVTYTDRGAPRLAALFVKDGEHAFYEKHYMDSNAFQSSFNTFSGQGFALTNVNAASIGGKTLYGGVWRKRPGSWVARHGMTPQDYQAQFDQHSSNGYRLHQVYGYNDSERFAAVWVKP
jgi:murein DD-endopeptidase MepM/ murein hydrolase activator NlpD